MAKRLNFTMCNGVKGAGSWEDAQAKLEEAGCPIEREAAREGP